MGSRPNNLDPMPTVASVIASEQANALRDIATILGCPANADPLTDLDGLVSMVCGLAERAAGLRLQLTDVTRTNTQLRAQEEAMMANIEARIADAVAADRMAAGAWIRACVPEGGGYARCIEHGDHIDDGDGAPPLPSLRMMMLARDEAWRQVETLTARVLELEAPGECQSLHKLRARVHDLEAERDRRIEPVEHARAVMRAYLLVAGGLMWRWARSPAREELLARVGADVLAEVER